MTLKKLFILFVICKKMYGKNSNKFEKIRKTSWLKIRNSIRFEGKIIRFVRFEKFSIRLIRKYFFNSKNSRKINSKFVRFDSTPLLVQARPGPKANIGLGPWPGRAIIFMAHFWPGPKYFGPNSSLIHTDYRVIQKTSIFEMLCSMVKK